MKKLFLIPILTLTLTVTFVSCKEKANKLKEAEVVDELEAVAEENFGGLALYTVRDAMGENAKETLKAVADAGYKNIEAASYAEGKFYDMSPTDFKAYLDEVGLTPISTHQGTVTLENADQMMADVKAAGFEYFVIPVPPMGMFEFNMEERTMNMKGTAAELAERKANRIAKRAKGAEQQKLSGKMSPLKAMKTQHAGLLAGADGLAPEVADLSAEDISYAKEQHLSDLERPFLDTAPEDMADGIEVGELGSDSGNKKMILALAREIAAGQHGDVDSLLIHHDGRLIFESYFRRGRANYPHYQMSITKSYTALVLGRAIRLGHLKMSDLDRPVLDFLTDIDQSKLAAGSDTITLNDALNMHSGIRVDKETVAKLRKSTGRLKGQGQIQAYLENTAPITTESKQYKYQSSDPSIVMQVIETVVPGTAREFINRELLKPMGISNFGWQDDVSGLPKSAAGSSMRSRDMIKWGMLVQNGGEWDGEQLIPADFIQKATSRIHTNPQDTSYGFFWWRHNVEVNGKTYDMKSGRGAGGQFIMMIDELDLIIAVTSHTKGMGKMLNVAPERIIPAMISRVR